MQQAPQIGNVSYQQRVSREFNNSISIAPEANESEEDMLVELKAKAADSDKAIVDITKRNDMLSEPLSHAEEMKEVRKEAKEQTADLRASLAKKEERIERLQDKLLG